MQVAFAAVGDRIPISVRLAGSEVLAVTRVASASAHVLVLSTTITSPRAPYGLYSTYVGQRGGPTAATQLLLAPAAEPELTQRQHEAHELPVAEDERHLCLYDHLQYLLAALVRGGHEPQIDVADQSIALVDR